MSFPKPANMKVSLFTGIFVGIIILLLECFIPDISYLTFIIIIPILVAFGYWLGNMISR